MSEKKKKAKLSQLSDYVRSSQLYHTFDQILLLSHGRALFSGAGGFAPAEHFSARGIAYHEGYNVADYLLDVASDAPVSLFGSNVTGSPDPSVEATANGKERAGDSEDTEKGLVHHHTVDNPGQGESQTIQYNGLKQSKYAATFLTQLEVLSGREWKILQR